MKPLLYLKDEQCCNCKACANICPKNAIEFKIDKLGFEYPFVNESVCVECGQCVRVCVFNSDKGGNVPIEGYAVRHKEFNICRRSSSGGMFTAIAEYIISKGGIVYGCAFNEHMTPYHIGVDTFEGLGKLRGSKYVQSDMGNTYRSIRGNLGKGKLVLFTGTPCQVAALYSFLGKMDTTNLFTVDLVCHGVPSVDAFKKYLSYLEKKFSRKITSFRFRDKKYEWERPSISVGFDNKYKRWFANEDVYYENFRKSLLQRPSCFFCRYANEKRFGDFTIGDFWGYQKGNLSMSKKEGISCCLINTPKAKSIFEFLKINYEKVNTSIIIQGNTALRKCYSKSSDWEKLINEISENGFDRIAYEFNNTHRMIHIKSFIKKIVLRRLHK